MAFEPDVIIASGDYTGHDIAAKKGKAHENYAILKATISDCFSQYIGALFPNTIVIPAIGNNDAKWHYEFPLTKEDSQEYYGFLFDLWFDQLKGNVNYTKKDAIKKTFMEGGYFVYDYNNEISFMCINSLYFSVKNAEYYSDVSKKQLDWIENTLKKAGRKKKFILNMHVFPGMYNPGEKQQFWEDEYNNRFDDIMKKYGDKVLMLNGAHTHISDVRASYKIETPASSKSFLKTPESEKIPYYANFVSPSISPIFLNNPGFASFNIDKTTINNITMHFLELDMTYDIERTKNSKDVEFHSVNFEKEFGIKEWSPQAILDWKDRAQADDELFTKFLVLKLGYRMDQKEAALDVYKNLNMIDFEDGNKIYWCFFQYIRSDEYDECVSS